MQVSTCVDVKIVNVHLSGFEITGAHASALLHCENHASGHLHGVLGHLHGSEWGAVFVPDTVVFNALCTHHRLN